MKRSQRLLTGAFLVLFLAAWTVPARGFYVDKKNTLSFNARIETRATIRLNDADGYTDPDVKTGDLVQHRNLALIEIDHDLRQLTKKLDILYPLKALKIRAKYHLVGRFMYEGIYDYGPDKFQDLRDIDRENIDDFKQSYDLWECYLDLSRGPWFFRLGRQNLAWGETDIFRLLDGINPLDNSFGGPFEDLDDRRIPLWMVRGSYNLGTVGPISSLTIEGFWVPGFWDARVSPWAPNGTPYEVPLPKKEVVDSLYAITPDKKGSNSRWGFRLQGMLGANTTVSLAHYKTFPDNPTTHLVVTEPVEGPLMDTSPLQVHNVWRSVHVTGGSINYWDALTNAVFRGEVALFWKEAVFMQGINDSPLFQPTIPLPPPILDLLAQSTGMDIRSLGLDGLPLNPTTGKIPKKNILRYMIGFDKQFWFRPLNRKNMFFLSMQYFGQWIPDHDVRIRTAVQIPHKKTADGIKDLTQYPNINETEHIFTGMLNTVYMHGNLTPQLAVAYDLRGAWLIQPSINFIREPFRFKIQYSAIEGNFVGLGLFRDRDQITFSVAYLIN